MKDGPPCSPSSRSSRRLNFQNLWILLPILFLLVDKESDFCTNGSESSASRNVQPVRHLYTTFLHCSEFSSPPAALGALAGPLHATLVGSGHNLVGSRVWGLCVCPSGRYPADTPGAEDRRPDRRHGSRSVPVLYSTQCAPTVKLTVRDCTSGQAPQGCGL